jgi:hypothetical protein
MVRVVERSFLAGLRQFFQPRFTAEEIFDLRGDDRLPLAREPGVANLATGAVGIASLAKPQLRAAGASGAGRSGNENIAMIGDLLLWSSPRIAVSCCSGDFR